MAKLTPSAQELAMQRMIGIPGNRSKGLTQQQTGALAGAVPTDTTSVTFPTPASATDRVAADYGILQPYGSGTGTGQWMTMGVGYETLDNSGNPMMRSGNLLVTKAGATYFQDGGWVLLDAEGNVVAGYCESLGVFGFGGGGGGGSTVTPADSGINEVVWEIETVSWVNFEGPEAADDCCIAGHISSTPASFSNTADTWSWVDGTSSLAEGAVKLDYTASDTPDGSDILLFASFQTQSGGASAPLTFDKDVIIRPRLAFGTDPRAGTFYDPPDLSGVATGSEGSPLIYVPAGNDIFSYMNGEHGCSFSGSWLVPYSTATLGFVWLLLDIRAVSAGSNVLDQVSSWGDQTQTFSDAHLWGQQRGYTTAPASGGGGGGGGGGLLNPALVAELQKNGITSDEDDAGAYLYSFVEADVLVDTIGLTFSDSTHISLPDGLYLMSSSWQVEFDAGFGITNTDATQSVLVAWGCSSLNTAGADAPYAPSDEYCQDLAIIAPSGTVGGDGVFNNQTAGLAFGGTNVEGSSLCVIANDFVSRFTGQGLTSGGLVTVTPAGPLTLNLIIVRIM